VRNRPGTKAPPADRSFSDAPRARTFNVALQASWLAGRCCCLAVPVNIHHWHLSTATAPLAVAGATPDHRSLARRITGFSIGFQVREAPETPWPFDDERVRVWLSRLTDGVMDGLTERATQAECRSGACRSSRCGPDSGSTATREAGQP